MGNLLLSAVIKYAESHPDQVVNLIEQGVQAAINALIKHNSASVAK